MHFDLSNYGFLLLRKTSRESAGEVDRTEPNASSSFESIGKAVCKPVDLKVSANG